MSACCIMIQGTGSNVGKSVLVTALCRIFAQDGYRVAPFKAQNMSLNSFVTKEGDEMGRAQVVQAEAAFIEPHVDMNPILLKPTSNQGSQVILHGKPLQHLMAEVYSQRKPMLWDAVTQSLERLRQQYDIIVIEGAGSPAEINLRANDIVNMAIALYVQCPVLLVGDIDRGGVFAWLIGTLDLLSEEERKLVQGLVINKFRGDLSLFASGVTLLEERSGKKVAGVLPYVRDLRIEDEDSVSLEESMNNVVSYGEENIDIAVIRSPHISNFTDFDALSAMEGVSLRYVTRPEALGFPDVIILPGTKNTLVDMIALKERGLFEAIKASVDRGAYLIGICGGFQMLGLQVSDPDRVESSLECVKGLGLLNITTVMNPEKLTKQVQAKVSATDSLFGFSGELTGYEIHQGETELKENARPLLEITKRSGNDVSAIDGAISLDGKVWGTYLHGIFDNDSFRLAFINHLRKEKGLQPVDTLNNFQFGLEKQRQYDQLAQITRDSLDIGFIYKIMGI